MIGEFAEWSQQINATLAEVLRRLSALEARTGRLDAHSGELARELLDVIERLDRLEERVTRQEREPGR